TSARDRLSMLMMRTAISIALALWMLLLALWQVHAQFFRPPASVYEHMRAKQMKILATAAVLALTRLPGWLFEGDISEKAALSTGATGRCHVSTRSMARNRWLAMRPVRSRHNIDRWRRWHRLLCHRRMVQ